MQIVYQQSTIFLSEGASGLELADLLGLKAPDEALAMVIDGKEVDLSHPLSSGDQVEFLHFKSEKGKEIFWHTSAHLLAQAVLRLYPEARPTIGPSIENGFYYDFANLSLSCEDLIRIEKEMYRIAAQDIPVSSLLFVDKEEAKAKFFSNPYKIELIEQLEEEVEITAYRQDEFLDLCRGPHLPSLGKIRAIKLLKTSGAYWRGDSSKVMLTRIYGISFPSQKELEAYLSFLEEAKKRDHRLLGRQLDLFSFAEEAPGMVLMHPKGMVIWDGLLDLWSSLHEKAGYHMIKTPQMMRDSLWKCSGHWDYYRENMFIYDSLVIKPMNCPGCMLYYKSRSHSYRELPLRIGEVGLVHRREPSGALNGLFRVQGFHQDDAHIFVQPCQVKEEVLSIFRLVKEIYGACGLEYFFELSTQPEKAMGTSEDWDVTIRVLREALDEWGTPYSIHAGDGAFYGPKIDIYVFDSLRRKWQCGTIQLDSFLPVRFCLEYKDGDGKMKCPLLIHRAIFGSLERFLAILIEHFFGRFPLWLSPNPVYLVPIADRHLDFAHKIASQVRRAGLHCTVDNSRESINKKIRNGQQLQANYMVIVGDKESTSETISVRTRDHHMIDALSVEHFIRDLLKEKRDRSLFSIYSSSK